MGKLDQHTAPPLPDLSLDGSDQECPECGHERGKPYYSPWAWLGHRLGMKPRPAECEWRVEIMADTCECPNHFHGS